MSVPVTRRSWLQSALVAVALLFPSRAWALGEPAHPVPRKGITGKDVATPAMLTSVAYLTELFDAVRNIPHIVDGIRCHCGCADMDGHYSLLTCYEGPQAMAMVCPICQGEGRVAVRMAKAGRSLGDIRIAIDAQFG